MDTGTIDEASSSWIVFVEGWVEVCMVAVYGGVVELVIGGEVEGGSSAITIVGISTSLAAVVDG